MRKIGNALEYVFAKYLLDKRFRPLDIETSCKIIKLQEDFNALFTKKDLDLFLKKLESFFMKYYNGEAVMPFYNGVASKFKLNSDNSGVHGDPSDIIIKTPSYTLPISIKYNNDSIKHHRPECLWRQLSMTKKDSNTFIYEYDAFLESWKKSNRNIINFSQLNSIQRSSLIAGVNSIIYKWMCYYNMHKNKKFIRLFVKFLIGNSNCIIIKWSKTKKDFNQKRYCSDDFDCKLSISATDNKISISNKRNRTIYMRLHSCSTSIISGNRFNLKYDVKIH